ncbi:MAG: ABC transporter ATP-binding protein [Gammaproteobacteria bacterium]|nr:ABC transporter ATP-binding protein [Gammaproteobacteria bacterium]
MSAAVTIADVHKRFPGVHALKGISFAIQRGEFFGLLGPNGAGKSTLINIIAGLTRCDSGRVSVLTHDVVQDYRQARRCLGVVPQELVFDPFFTVHEVLRIQSGYFGLRRENASWIKELMDNLDLSDKANTNMRALSGGMKRRVLIAQALAHKPEVVVLDEPTAGVDVALRKSLWAFIRRLHEEGHTIVLTTHYLEEAELLCDRIAILNHGNVVALDTKQALLQRGIGKTVNVWITADEPVPALSAELQAVLRAQDGTRLEFRLDNKLNSIGDLLEGLRTAGLVITDLHTEEPDLEDVFLDLTRGREE